MALSGRDTERGRILAIEEQLEVGSWNPWIRDVVIAARDAGYEVLRDAEQVAFLRPGEDPIRIQHASHSDAIDALQRQSLLGILSAQPNPVPIQTQDDGTLTLATSDGR